MNENNLVLALNHVESIANETVKIGKSIDAIKVAINAIKLLGFIAIQNGQTKTLAENELPYKAFKTAVSSKFLHLEGRAKTIAISDLRQSINYGLENGTALTDSNTSRAKKSAEKTSDKKGRAPATPKAFDCSAIIAALMLGWISKYSETQIDLLVSRFDKSFVENDFMDFENPIDKLI